MDAYPDVWWKMGLPTPPALLHGWGFASFIASRTRLLVATMRLQTSGFVTRLMECGSELSSSASCQQHYTTQREWAAGVLAATASSVNPNGR
jgi:hypothetical protein